MRLTKASASNCATSIVQLAKLPDEQRTVILLVGLEGMRYEAVADIIGVPVVTVRSRLSRGREALRRLMGIVPDRHAEAIMAEPAPRRAAPQSLPRYGTAAEYRGGGKALPMRYPVRAA